MQLIIFLMMKQHAHIITSELVEKGYTISSLFDNLVVEYADNSASRMLGLNICNGKIDSLTEDLKEIISNNNIKHYGYVVTGNGTGASTSNFVLDIKTKPRPKSKPAYLNLVKPQDSEDNKEEEQ